MVGHFPEKENHGRDGCQPKRGKGVFHSTSGLSKGRDWETAGKWFCVNRSSVATGEWVKNGELIAAQIVLEFS